MNWLDEVAFDDRGLVPVVTQDAESGKVLMLAWANREALEETAETGRAVYFSRSRQKLWRKGEKSGNIQVLVSVQLDCDGDAVLYKVHQKGGIACHTGRASCFYRTLQSEDRSWNITSDPLKDPREMYRG